MSEKLQNPNSYSIIEQNAANSSAYRKAKELHGPDGTEGPNWPKMESYDGAERKFYDNPTAKNLGKVAARQFQAYSGSKYREDVGREKMDKVLMDRGKIVWNEFPEEYKNFRQQEKARARLVREQAHNLDVLADDVGSEMYEQHEIVEDAANFLSENQGQYYDHAVEDAKAHGVELNIPKEQ